MKKLIHSCAWLVLAAFCIIGIFKPSIGIAAIFCMLMPSIVALFKGRMWCGYFCPRGSFNDIILSCFSMKQKTPNLFKANWFRLTFMFFILCAFAIQITLVWSNFIAVSHVFIKMILITTNIDIILGIIFNHRAWCMICPMGTMAHYVSKAKVFRRNIKYIPFDKNNYS